MAAWLRLWRLLALNGDLALVQLRSDMRFVCLTAFGVVIGTAVLAAAIGIAGMAEQRLAVIKEEIGTQMLFLSISSNTPAEFLRLQGRLLDDQAVAALGVATGTFTRQATFLRGSTRIGDQGEQRDTSVLGFADGDLKQLELRLSSGSMGGADVCYLDAASVPVSQPRLLQVGDGHCALQGTFWRSGMLSALLSGESGQVMLTSFQRAYAVLGQQAQPPSLLVALRLETEAKAFAALAVLGEFMQQHYPDSIFSLEWPGARLMPLNALVDQVRLVAVLVGGLIMLISAVAMANAMLAQIGQRRREFGIRLAIGAMAQDLILQTLFEVLMIFGGGLLVGFGLAVTIMYLWGVFSGWLFLLTPSLFLISASVTLVCALCSALYPALVTSRIEPIQAMQHT